MLLALHIENIALIDRLDISFGRGFNVLSGETGAGKSIIIDAMNFVLGERSSKELIRYGADKARVEATFASSAPTVSAVLEEEGLEEDGELILSRELSQAGKNSCRVNGTLVSVSTLKRISDALIDIHGQHEHQSLLSADKHITFLDSFAHKEITPLLEKADSICEAYEDTRREKNAGFASEAERERETDILTYQIKEIENARLSEGEEEALRAERTLLANAERIKLALTGAAEALRSDGGGALGSIDSARRALAEISGLSEEYAAFHARADEAYYQLEDVAYSVRDAADSLEFDEGRLDKIERRLEKIKDITKKYGGGAAETLDYLKEAKEKLERLAVAKETEERLERELERLEAEYDKYASALTLARKNAALELRTRVIGNLKDMGLEKADFEARLMDEAKGRVRRGGRESAEFFLTANPGEPMKPLEKVASGGELSRIMLCFKAIFADNDSIDTLIFDEIDTGISGAVAAKVGEKMLSIARMHQVICVTHLPQIAALADGHYVVEKHEEGARTVVGLSELDEEGKMRRIAKMMDGDDTSSYALEHAAKLIERRNKLNKGE